MAGNRHKGDAMPSITERLSLDHERCDTLFAGIEAAIAANDAALALAAFTAFHHAMQHHFAMEDAILFPAFDLIDNGDLGLTHHMRLEHEQMRELIEQMQAALNGSNLHACAGLVAELSPLMQQHNLKEEEVLYPLLDRALGGKTEELVQRIEALPQAPF